MTYFVCIAVGQADFMPDDQAYVSAASLPELIAEIENACTVWIADLAEGESFYRHAFRAPREGEDNWSQRLLIAESSDLCLDVIGMTESDFEREAA